MNNVFSRYPLNHLGNMYRIALSLPPFRDLVQLEDQRNLSFPETMRYSALTWKHSVPRESTSDKPSKICFINRLAFPMLIDSCPAASFARHRQMQHPAFSYRQQPRAVLEAQAPSSSGASAPATVCCSGWVFASRVGGLRRGACTWFCCCIM